MADTERIESGIHRTIGALEEGLKRKADASEMQLELRRAVEYSTGETRREVRLVMDRIDAVRDDLRRDINGIEEDIEEQSEKVTKTADELHKVAGKVDRLTDGLAEVTELVKGLASRPRTTVGEWVRWGLLALGVVAAFVTGNWGALSSLIPR